MNSATNPRKFAEKIAKLHQKEQEQTQAFEQIMAEVIVATRVWTVRSLVPAARSAGLRRLPRLPRVLNAQAVHLGRPVAVDAPRSPVSR